MKTGFLVNNAFTDHMVLQRNKPIRINGFATPFVAVYAEMNGVVVSARAAKDYSWELELPPLNAGGPYDIRIYTAHGASKKIRDVLIGDVWLCSGQSNMEFFIWRDEGCCLVEKEAKALMADTADMNIRFLRVDHSINPLVECDMLPENSYWSLPTDSERLAWMSAVGYYFGKELRKFDPSVPIGVISSSWGGTRIEPWIPEEYYRKANLTAKLDYLAKVRECTSEDYAKKTADKDNDEKFFAWIDSFNNFAPEKTAVALTEWVKPDADLSSWERKEFAGIVEPKTPGITWYKKEISLPENFVGSQLSVFFGALNDEDEVFFDDVKIGETTCHTVEWWAMPRLYMIPVEKATAGKHVISVRLKDHNGSGNFSGGAYLCSSATSEKIDLKQGEWYKKNEFAVDFEKIGKRPGNLPGFVLFEYGIPSCLYNSMIKPLTVLEISGVLWYQGCSNAGEPREYEGLQKLLIEAWRGIWKNPKLPFLICQLSAWYEQRPDNRYPDDFWKDHEPNAKNGFQRLREVQKLAAEEIENVGLAVTIDIGDHSDIHPTNKHDVAKRLAACAKNFYYGVDVPYLCPDCESTTEKDGGLLLKIKNAGDNGLYLKDATVIGEHMFELAGADGIYKWAQAKLVGKDEIFVFADDVAEPKTVRYAWSPFPPFANIYSSDDLPLQPFRTDTEELY